MAGKCTVMTPKMIESLKVAFSMGLSDREACLYCDLGESTFYEYCSRNPDFAELKEILKENPKIKAKIVVNKKIEEGDDFNARWYLERKSKDEFSIKTVTDNTVKGDLTINDYKNLSTEELLRLKVGIKN